MLRALSVTLGLACALVVARPASAIPVSPVDLNTVALNSQVGGTMIDAFTTLLPPPDDIGDATTRVFFDGVNYIYTQTVFPTGDFNFVYNTEFSVSGFTGTAGWRFSDAAAFGAGGNSSDFHIENVGGNLVWTALFGGAFGEWNSFEPITFFFVSTLPPTIKNYNLFSLMPLEFASAQGLAPVPEPGSIALFGSGVAALYAAYRRRRHLKM